MRLVKTCDSCPEQYDAFHGKRKVGYLRLRHGHFTVEYLSDGTLDSPPDLVYEAHPDGDGAFADYERGLHLNLAMAALRERMRAEEQS